MMIAYDHVNRIADLFSAKFIFLSLLISIIGALFLLPLTKKYLQILQQSSYRNCEFNKWLKKKPNFYNSRLWVLSILSILSYALIVICFSFLKFKYLGYVAFISYFLFIICYVLGDKKHKDKCPMVYTNRVKRLIGCFFIISFIFIFTFLTLLNIAFYYVNVWYLRELRLSLLLITPSVLPQILKFANVIICPLEKKINKKFLKMAKAKLDGYKEMVKIGITGSYGKTSIKNILHTILSVKYKVFSTPKSYNTPMGVCKSVNDLDESYDVFICEMGARYTGDIKELCDLVNPSFGILSGITKQHLDTFKTLENIKNTKAELIKAVKKTCVISSDSQETLSLKDTNSNCKILTAGISDSSDVFAQDIKCYQNGSEFTLNFNGLKIKASTKLLGEHNVSNIVLASALCFELGLTPEEISQGIAKIETTPHRLELVQNDKGITIIDDSYNANPVGSKVAIKVAKSFDSRTIVVTPGMVELGKIERQENIEFGKNLSVCDIIILVGTTCAYSVREGLYQAGFNFDNVYMVKTLSEAKEKLSEIVKSGDVVLFENDLPDRFL